MFLIMVLGDGCTWMLCCALAQVSEASGPSWVYFERRWGELLGLILPAQLSTAATVAVYHLSVLGWTVLHKILG